MLKKVWVVYLFNMGTHEQREIWCEEEPSEDELCRIVIEYQDQWNSESAKQFSTKIMYEPVWTWRPPDDE